jgi:crotonobetainyl-CoA:carnitine CoA-transferase CaiB-like acyl-CoA transferase
MCYTSGYQRDPLLTRPDFDANTQDRAGFIEITAAPTINAH